MISGYLGAHRHEDMLGRLRRAPTLSILQACPRRGFVSPVCVPLHALLQTWWEGALQRVLFQV